MSQQINLFNPIFLKQKKLFSAVTMLQALALVFVGSIVVTVIARAQLSSIDAEAAATTVRLHATQAQLAKVKAEYGPHAPSKELQQEIRKAQAELLLEHQILTVARNGNFAADSGYSDYLQALARQVVSGLWLTGLTIAGAGNGIELDGRALHPELVPEYIKRLKREPVMAGKSFSALQMKVPMVDAPAPAGTPAAAPKQVPANFVEFRLQSAAVAAATAADSGTNESGATAK